MVKTVLSFLFICLSSLLFAQSLIPIPTRLEKGEGQFTIQPNTTLYCDAQLGGLENASVRQFLQFMEQHARLRLPSTRRKNKINTISCSYVDTLASSEAYELIIDERHIAITAKSDEGLFHAFQTLRQLLPVAIEMPLKMGAPLSLSCLTIYDTPRFAYRGLMLDVARHFMPKEFVFKLLDVMGMYKFNRLHLHLTDNQGWRVEIKKYPKLTEIGAYRDRTMIGHTREATRPYQWDTHRYGGFYTQDDIREIVAYAQARCIEIVPEFDIPAHTFAALAAYPEFSCSGGPFEIEGIWRPFYDVLCTKESTFTFLEEVYDELLQLFPSKYIHIGGDEVRKLRWKNCHACQERMKREGLQNEDELQDYMVNRVASHILRRGRIPVGWDDILNPNVNKELLIISWQGVQGGIQAARMGLDAVMAPSNYLYFDFAQHKGTDEPIAQGGTKGRVITLADVYAYNPIPSDLPAEVAKHIIGVQGCLWTEYVPTVDHAEYLLFPRAMAVAEMGWSPQVKRNFTDFLERLDEQLPRLDALRVNHDKKYKQ